MKTAHWQGKSPARKRDVARVASSSAGEAGVSGEGALVRGAGYDIRRVALSATVGGQARSVQRAMSVSQPGDPSEVEADRVADSVMRMEAVPDLTRSGATVTREELPEEEEQIQTKRLDRFEIAREELPEEEEVQTKRLDREASQELPEEDEQIQTKRISRAGDNDVEGGADVSHIVGQGLSGGGQPLDSASRAFFEPRLGQDLSSIRVHTGAQASQSAEQVSARAYAVGNNIAFRDGEYSPGTSAGRHLLAHELAHTVQQGATTPLSRKTSGSRGAALNRMADAVGGALVQRFEAETPVNGMGSGSGPSQVKIGPAWGMIEGQDWGLQLPFDGFMETVTLAEGTTEGRARFRLFESVEINNMLINDHHWATWEGIVPFTTVAEQLVFGSPITNANVGGSGATMSVAVASSATPGGGYATFTLTIAAAGSVTAGGSIGVGPISASAPVSTASNFAGGLTRTFTINLRTTPPAPIVAPDVSFDVNSANLTDGQEGVISGWFNGLSEANKAAIRNGKRAISLSGYASRTSSRKHNRELSEQRAHVVERILRGHVGSGAAINIFYFGEDNTPGPNEIENPQFRRATIQVQSPTNIAPGAPGK